jgi:hypothetical protein
VRFERWAAVLIALFGAACWSAARAQAPVQGPYVGAGGGFSLWEINLDCGCDDTGTALRLGAGWRFNRILALEAVYLDLGRATPSGSALIGDFRARAAGLVLLIGGQVGNTDIAGKVGMARVSTRWEARPGSISPSARRSSNEPLLGFMVGHWIAPNLAVRFDIDYTQIDAPVDVPVWFFSQDPDVTTVTFGVSYRF